MVYMGAEIEVLCLHAICKDMPTDGADIIPEEILSVLRKNSLIRETRQKTSSRITAKGRKLLNEAGFDYPEDKQYRTAADIITRRLQVARIVSFFWRYGADVLSENVPADITENLFLPSFTFRRKASSNVLGSSSLTGIYYTKQTAFTLFFLNENGIYTDMECRTFSAETISKSKVPFALYTADGDLKKIVLSLTSLKDTKGNTDGFYTALSKFNCPVAVFPLTENGFRQIRILSIKDYKKKLCRYVLSENYRSSDFDYVDAVDNKTGEKWVLGFDLNIYRFDNSITENRKPTHILLLDFQIDAVKKILSGRNVILHSISLDIAEDILNIPHTVADINRNAFVKKDGGNIYVQTIR